jgi:hypothetical protein
MEGLDPKSVIIIIHDLFVEATSHGCPADGSSNIGLAKPTYCGYAQ